MSDVAIIGLDLAKRVFQLHGARADGSVAFRLKLPSRLLKKSALDPVLGT